eukprot:scaffold33223_cov38-Cyclotella_meneghiniana.AAC.4
MKKGNETCENPIPCNDLHNWSVKIVDGFNLVIEVAGSGMNLLNHNCLSANCSTVVTANNHGDLVVVAIALCNIQANTELTINYGHRDNDEITPNTHPTVCNCGAFAAQKKHYMELGSLPLNLKEDACDAID